METAINGFRKTGIWPINREVFKIHDFAPSETTNRPDPSTVLSDPPSRSPNNTPSSSLPDGNTTEETRTLQIEESNDISQIHANDTPKADKIQLPTYTKCPTPEDILPIPSCSGLHLKKKSGNTVKQLY